MRKIISKLKSISRGGFTVRCIDMPSSIQEAYAIEADGRILTAWIHWDKSMLESKLDLFKQPKTYSTLQIIKVKIKKV